MTAHEQTHTKPRFKCNYCTKTFSRQRDIKRHTKAAHNDQMVLEGEAQATHMIADPGGDHPVIQLAQLTGGQFPGVLQMSSSASALSSSSVPNSLLAQLMPILMSGSVPMNVTLPSMVVSSGSSSSPSVTLTSEQILQLQSLQQQHAAQLQMQPLLSSQKKPKKKRKAKDTGDKGEGSNNMMTGLAPLPTISNPIYIQDPNASFSAASGEPPSKKNKHTADDQSQVAMAGLSEVSIIHIPGMDGSNTQQSLPVLAMDSHSNNNSGSLSGDVSHGFSMHDVSASSDVVMQSAEATGDSNKRVRRPKKFDD